MNTKHTFIALTLGVLGFTSCSDLDTEPEGNTLTSDTKTEVVAKDPSKSKAAVTAIFAQMTTYMPNYDALGSQHNDFGYPSIMLFTDANSEDFLTSNTGYNWMGSNLRYTDRIYTSNCCQIIWNDLYSYIYNANAVIGSIDSETDNSQSQFYLAQGLAMRAFSYFILAQLYQFNYDGHQSSPCVPIITCENSEEAALNGVARSSVQEVYDLIYSDIDKAVSLLEAAKADGVDRDDKRYIDLATAYGIRARINLTTQKWTEAAKDAEAAIQNSTATPASIDAVSRPYFWESSESDWMWGIIIAETDDVVSSGIVNWISHMGSLNYGYAEFSGGCQISKKLYNKISETDVRKGWWTNADGVSPNLTAAEQASLDSYSFAPYTQVKFAPYNMEVETATNANDIPLMRIEEMYLIKAEGEAMSGNTGAAKSTLEGFVKAYRDPEYVCTVSGASDIQEEVYFQRRVELWGEGLTWYDVMRLNKGIDRRGCGFNSAVAIFNIAPNDPILLWRIPEAEIQANPALSDEDNNPAVEAPAPVADIE